MTLTKNDKILIGVGIGAAAIAAYFLYFKKNGTGIQTQSELDEIAYEAKLAAIYGMRDAIEETDPVYGMVKNKFSKESVEKFWKDYYQPSVDKGTVKQEDLDLQKKAWLKQLEDNVMLYKAINSDLSNLSTTQIVDCLSKDSTVNKEMLDYLTKNGLSRKSMYNYIKEMGDKYPNPSSYSPEEKERHCVVNVYGALFEMGRVIGKCNPSLMPLTVKTGLLK